MPKAGTKTVLPNTLHWFRWTTAGGDFDILLAPQSVFAEWGVPEAEGCTFPNEGFVILDDTLAYRRLVRVLFHELMHTVVSDPNETETLALILHCTIAESNQREEDVVTHVSPKLCDSLDRNGMLKLPPLPKGHKIRK